MINIEEMTLDIEQNIEISGTADDVFKSMVKQLGEGFKRPDGESMHLQLEQWAGGRWYRDLGDGIQYLWGHVQVIKAPTLLELSGPMFMSYPALNHLELKLTETESGTKVYLRHRAIGMIDAQHREGVKTGWNAFLEGIKNDLSKTSSSSA
jgi:Activator of Hsp90 ATPase homolog 1-like protein